MQGGPGLSYLEELLEEERLEYRKTHPLSESKRRRLHKRYAKAGRRVKGRLLIKEYIWIGLRPPLSVRIKGWWAMRPW
jgi:hypothetical protein